MFSAEGREQLATLPATSSFSGRTEMAKAVCQLFDFTDARGELRVSSCLSVLRDLETASYIQLPPSGQLQGRSRTPRVLDAPVPFAKNVPDVVNDVLGLHLQLVTQEADRRILSN